MFIAKRALKPNGEWDEAGGTDGCGFWLPREWQRTPCDESTLDKYEDGDAVCVVMGHGLSLTDFDPRNGGDKTRKQLVRDGLMPIIVMSQTTPSDDGVHDFVNNLNVRSRDNVLPGLDVKAGDADGNGRGFAFIEPTVRVSKTTGEPTPYVVTTPLQVRALRADDDSGAAMRALVLAALNGEHIGDEEPVPYDGLPFDELPDDEQDRLTRYTNGAVASIRSELLTSRAWPEGYRDQKGRGWEKLCADAAMRLGSLARATWCPLKVAEAKTVHEDAAPTDSTWGKREVRAKWQTQHLRGWPRGYPADLDDDAVATSHHYQRVTSEVIPLEQAHKVVRRWLGEEYDLDAFDAMLATAAVEQLDGDPLWLLLISGSGNAKTETVQALDGIGAVVTSTISSQGALLSATAKREKAKNATGGLLRKLGDSGVLVVKDVTSILSMSGDARGEVLAAFREVHDGRWERNVGSDGGKSLEWRGRIAVVGAVTTAWDRAHNVISQMGDRFVLLRMDSTTGRSVAGRRAIGNVGSEVQMREELAEAVAGVINGADLTGSLDITEAETWRLLLAADLVTRARTGVDFDYRGDVIDSHAPEMPTRFAKQLAQLMRGAIAIGIPRPEALRLAIRCARDSMPPLRLAILDDIAEHKEGTTTDVRKRLGKPRATIDRQLQALQMLDVLDVDESVEVLRNGNEKTIWHYRLAADIDAKALDPGCDHIE